VPTPPRRQPTLSFEDTAYRRRLGTRIRDLRTERQWTQEDLSDKASLAREYLSKVESGHRNPSLDVIARLAKVLEVPLRDLFLDC
jgi:transcriptional regulator with XRE-family HTH domain